jgi:hypothetical protein
MDITQESIFFPKDVHVAHQRTIERIKMKDNQKLNRTIMKRAKELEKDYCFELRGLLIRPAGSYRELLAEGNALHHCVANYGKRYADGQTIILFIRRASEPDTPYYTMEVHDNRIIQCRGLKNCNPNKAVSSFVKASESKKLRNKKAKEKIPA